MLDVCKELILAERSISESLDFISQSIFKHYGSQFDATLKENTKES